MRSAGAVMIDGHEVDAARVRELCVRYGLVELAVFGSQPRGDAGPESDVDLFYVLAPGARLGFALNELEDDLSGLFGHRVDLVSKKFLHPLLRDTVLEQAITLYAAWSTASSRDRCRWRTCDRPRVRAVGGGSRSRPRPA